MNRNVLKIFALVVMLIDHIGAIFFPEILVLRIIGRLAFPIFAFFIAEGLLYTRNRKKYILLMMLFAALSQIPYALLFGWYHLNIFFTFLLSIGYIISIEHLKAKKSLVYPICYLVFASLFIVLMTTFSGIDYGLLGVILPVVFYFGKKFKFLFAVIPLILLGLEDAIWGGFALSSFIQFFALLSVPVLLLYNDKKGKWNLKYLFYIFYPLHLLIFFLCTL